MRDAIKLCTHFLYCVFNDQIHLYSLHTPDTHCQLMLIANVVFEGHLFLQIIDKIVKYYMRLTLTTNAAIIEYKRTSR